MHPWSSTRHKSKSFFVADKRWQWTRGVRWPLDAARTVSQGPTSVSEGPRKSFSRPRCLSLEKLFSQWHSRVECNCQSNFWQYEMDWFWTFPPNSKLAWISSQGAWRYSTTTEKLHKSESPTRSCSLLEVDSASRGNSQNAQCRNLYEVEHSLCQTISRRRVEGILLGRFWFFSQGVGILHGAQCLSFLDDTQSEQRRRDGLRFPLARPLGRIYDDYGPPEQKRFRRRQPEVENDASSNSKWDGQLLNEGRCPYKRSSKFTLDALGVDAWVNEAQARTAIKLRMRVAISGSSWTS